MWPADPPGELQRVAVKSSASLVGEKRSDVGGREQMRGGPYAARGDTVAADGRPHLGVDRHERCSSGSRVELETPAVALRGFPVDDKAVQLLFDVVPTHCHALRSTTVDFAVQKAAEGTPRIQNNVGFCEHPASRMTLIGSAPHHD